MSQRPKEGLDRRTMLKYTGLVGTGTLLAGCTGNKKQDGADGTAAEGPTPTATEAGSDSGDGEGGSTDDSTTDITYATSVTPSSIDPMKAADEFEALLTHNVYDPLLYYTDDTPPKLIPWLAESWEVGDDNKTYTFSIRDATFHNGDPVTADDVVYSVRRMLEMQQGFSYMWSGLLEPDNVVKVDDSTVEMTTSEVYAPFLSTLPFMFIVNKSQVEANVSGDDYGTAWLEENDAGAGPYKLANRERKSRVSLAIHGDWWGEFADGDSYETVHLDMIQEAATIVGKMKNGDADMAEQWLPLESHNELARQDDIEVSTKATFAPLYVFMHCQRPPFDDVDVRRAISYAFDYETMLNDIMAGDSEQLQGPLPSAMWGHADDAAQYEKDLDKAKELIDNSSYAGEDLELTYHYVTGITVRKNLGLMLQQDLNEIGIKLNVKKTPWSKIVSMHTNKDTSPQMVSTSLSFSYVDPDTFLYPAWHSSAHGSWQSGSWYENERVDELLDQARRKVTREERAPLYQEAQQIIADEAAAIFVQNTATRWPYNKRVEGFHDNGVTGYTHTFHRFHEQA